MKQELRQFQQEFEARATTQDVETLWADFKTKVHSLMATRYRNHGSPGKLKVSYIRRNCSASRERQETLEISGYIDRLKQARLQKAERKSYWNFVDREDGSPLAYSQL